MSKSQRLFFYTSAAVITSACSLPTSPPSDASNEEQKVSFINVSEAVGLDTQSTWKYGGPTVSDLNGDGHYDLVLTNHAEVAPPIFWATGDRTYRKHATDIIQGDIHGIAAGDYDSDGDGDLLISVGGGNGKEPKPPRLMQNNNGQFTDVTKQSGIAELGARGRSVRWIDIDLDGDLDILEISARHIADDQGPRNILFENLGNGKFAYRKSPGFEQVEAERVLLTDFNQDNLLDLVAFTPLTIWRNNKDFTFTDVTKEVLPTDTHEIEFISAAAQTDIDNDGDMDIYLARGKTSYELANNSIAFNPMTGRLDLRDQGSKSHDGISFYANDSISLTEFWHWKRELRTPLPIFIGGEKTKVDLPAGNKIDVNQQQASGFPSTLEHSGWYLGYLGDNKWRLEWQLKEENLAWGVRASIIGLTKVEPDWIPQDRNVTDMLLRNDNGKFTNISNQLPAESFGNNWGVTHGDFNNDGLEDFFIYRFGELTERVPDALLINQGNGQFLPSIDHGANVLGIGGHGDMGSAFDYNLDGAIDLLSGDDNPGKWYLYQNNFKPGPGANYLLLEVGYSTTGIDPLAAKITIQTNQGSFTKRIGSAGAVHSQSVLNIAHFGLGKANEIEKLIITWRDGATETLLNIKANQTLKVGK